MDGKLFLIDGHSLIFRMYYAFLRHPMINSKSEDVSILYGFTRYVLELIDKYKPTHMAVCFDPPGKTFRHQMYPEYKGTRQAAPELVIQALEPLIGICRALELPVLMVPGYEGDDVLGAMAVRSAAQGMQVYMVTPDKDFGQLVTDRILQLKPGKSGGEDEVVGPAELCAKLGITDPKQVVDMLTICGDAADNVPGVNGVGEVGASKLVSKYGTLDGIYEHLSELSPRQQELFNAAKDHIELSRKLVTIKTDIELDTTADDMLLEGRYNAEAAELFDRYEFPSLKRLIPLKEGQTVSRVVETPLPQYDTISPEALANKASASGMVSVVVDFSSNDCIQRLTMAVSEAGRFFVAEGKGGDFKTLLQDSSIVKVAYDLKLLYGRLGQEGISLGGRMDDPALLHYLINPEQSHKVEVLSRSYLNINLEQETAPQEEVQEDFGLFDAVPDDVARLKDRRLEAVAVLLLDDKLRQTLRSMDMEKLYDDMEEPLQRVLSRMESAGVKVDMAPLREYAGGLKEEMLSLEAKIRKALDDPELNISSPRQIGVALYEKLRIDPRRKPDPKKNYPTDEETLMNYADGFPVIYDILDYRGVKKLLSTYIEPFGEWISPHDGRVHTTFNQALTSTGRLSSSRPNLQNIPIRTERGREIRKAFVASSPDHVIVSADYSQIELRLMAHFCGDVHMREAFVKGEDVHAITASKIFNVAPQDITPDMRRQAKTANFGIMYGISAFGLAQRLKMPRVAAKRLIEDYFSNFPSIRKWIDETVASASEKGYVQTMFGRRRYLPDINSRNATTRALAARNAVNAPIQGTAADIIKKAMNAVDRALEEKGMKSRMVLQIHDELVFDAPRTEVEDLMKIIRDKMENVISLSIPLTVECNYGNNWLEAH